MTTTTADDTTDDPAVLREQMIREIAKRKYLHHDGVRDALRAVPRHLFVPDAPVRNAYQHNLAITTKPNTSGGRLPRSCASVPTVVAMMLEYVYNGPPEDTSAAPPVNVLEIGAGTGYNAALLAEVAGPGGHVVTIDIHPDVTAEARSSLDALGYSRVEVITADGVGGYPASAPYDAIIATVGPWDLPPAWTRQLAPGGRLVVPLRFRGNSRCVQFFRDGDLLRAESSRLCGFIPMEGPNQDGERETVLDAAGALTLTWDADQDITPAALVPALDQPGDTVWSGVILHDGESFDAIWLRLAAAEHGACRLSGATSEGLPDLVICARTPAVVDGDSLAYLVLREIEAAPGGVRRNELGAAACGPAGAAVAARFAEHILAWDTDREALPTITAYPAGTPDDDLPSGQVIDKPSNRVVISY
ncbi:MAG: fxlM [Amycolatopsis sp.]|uniref:methyltransferase, FxLD system n=1 Tax=Amycolatopsis sp. TaxID=37632 RepID=UPI0026290218|nr:methyltransferase, FxLD system [Amycolatopsis sp.]MCU1685195.1 fxlM [Amycolatopsis sp.]